VRVSLRYAVMSFCADLTDPEAVARAVAIVGAGRAYLPQGRVNDFAFYVVRNRPGSDLALPQDRLSQSILSGLPALFDRQIFDAMAGVGLERFLPWLQNRFRNSLHVASIHEKKLDIRDPVELQGACILIYSEMVLRLRVREGLRVPTPEFEPFMFDEGYSFKVQGLKPKAFRAVG
jgi:hypothetical protein